MGNRTWRLPDADAEAIAARLIALRLACGYRYSVDWARYLGIHPTTLANYESGNRVITIPAALKYMQRTGVTLDWIYLGVEFALPVVVQRKLDIAAMNGEAKRLGLGD